MGECGEGARGGEGGKGVVNVARAQGVARVERVGGEKGWVNVVRAPCGIQDMHLSNW